jgi:microcin C transport system substrate-binding protein
MKNNLLVLLAVLTLAAGCGGGSTPESESGVSTPTARSGPVSMNKADYPVFPDADVGADPAVPAEQGGRGFTGQGWETNTDFDLFGDPRAVKGGVFRDWVPDFPGTFRVSGPDSNTYINNTVANVVYETLVGLDSRLEYMPSLASHWQISPDHMAFRFRINPNAKFSDGVPVTSEDVVATYKFMMDKTLQDPSNQLVFGKFNPPVAESKYIVRVQAKDLNWRNFLYFGASMPILPAHVLKNVNGAAYLKDYNYKLLPGTGPYVLREEDISKGRVFSVRRRNDYWASNSRGSIGTGNFDELRFSVVRDENLVFEMFKKGELDTYVVKRSPRQWVEELNFDNVQRGLIQKRKVFNSYPRGPFPGHPRPQGLHSPFEQETHRRQDHVQRVPAFELVLRGDALRKSQ